jgi:tetratricopeptide (TPR) repeat protein
MKLTIKKAVVVLIMILSVSCNEWLDLEPENDLIRQEFWKKESDVDAVIAAMYDQFREMSTVSLIWGELRGDLMEISGSKYPGFAQIANNEITPSNSEINWSGYYSAINLANTIMQFSGDVVDQDEEFTQKEKLAYDAEALFIRSICYFYLVRLWKDVPLMLSASSSDTVNMFLPKTEERIVLRHLIEDLKYAETVAYSTENKSIDYIFRGRANKFSIQALMADIYLWLENYEKCIEYCDKIINSNQYRLLDEINWFELYYPGNSQESIFEIQFNDDLQDESNPMFYRLTPIAGGLGIFPANDWEEIFSTGDIRWLEGTGGPARKYLLTSNEGNERRSENERDANIIYYRYADVLLMKAEAMAELERFREAGQLLNETMNRAGLPQSAIEETKKSYRDAILQERGREFLFEGKRWFDLLRFAKRNSFENKEIIISVLLSKATIRTRPQLESRVRDTMFYFLPIPERELNSNHNLEQNPFYDK